MLHAYLQSLHYKIQTRGSIIGTSFYLARLFQSIQTGKLIPLSKAYDP